MTNSAESHQVIDDPSAADRHVWWWASTGAVVTGVLIGAAAGDPSMAVALGLIGTMILSWLRARGLRSRFLALLDETQRTGKLAVRISILSNKRVQLVWTRPSGILRIANGRTTVTAMDGTIVFEAANQDYVMGPRKYGVRFDVAGRDPQRIMLVPGDDLGMYLAQLVVDRPVADRIEQVLQAGPTIPPPPGWHNDPTRAARLRWWDGQRWTDQTAN